MKYLYLHLSKLEVISLLTSTIAPELKTTKYSHVVPPLSPDQYESLKKSIANAKAIHYPIIANQHGDVLDGHHRLKICRELGIKPDVMTKFFIDELEERHFVIEINRARRQLKDWQDLELVMQSEEIYQAMARRNQQAGRNLFPNQEKLHTDEILAKMAGRSKDTIYKARKVLTAAKTSPGKDRLLTSLRSNKISLNEAYNQVKRAEKLAELQAQATESAEKLKLPSRTVLLNTDSMDPSNEQVNAVIADRSVDLIITDPLYHRENLGVYDQLAHFAIRKLKPGGSLVLYFGQYHRLAFYEAMSRYSKNLEWQWEIVVLHSGDKARIDHRGVWAEFKPMAWFLRIDGPKLAVNDIHDVLKSSKPDKSSHPYAQSSIEAEYLIRKLTVGQDAIICDPFMGTGAFLAPAIHHGKIVIGVELDKNRYDSAKSYLASQKPLPQEELLRLYNRAEVRDTPFAESGVNVDINSKPKMDRAWAMPNARSFSSEPIANLIAEECAGVPADKILDLFPYNSDRDALEVLKSLPTASKSRILVDPPYSQAQAKDLYEKQHNKKIKMISWESPKELWTEIRKEIARVIEPGGKCITLAWNSQGTGKGLGFEITRILLVAHGGNRNDTIVTVDDKELTEEQKKAQQELMRDVIVTVDKKTAGLTF